MDIFSRYEIWLLFFFALSTRWRLRKCKPASKKQLKEKLKEKNSQRIVRVILLEGFGKTTTRAETGFHVKLCFFLSILVLLDSIPCYVIHRSSWQRVGEGIPWSMDYGG